MKKNLLTLGIAMLSSLTFAQVGINISNPNATLDVVGSPNNPSKFDGVIPPRITGDQLTAKTYTTAQTGAIVYATEGVTASPSSQTTYVTAPGTYYFDGTRWIHYTPSAPYMSASVIARANTTQTSPRQQGDWTCVFAACGPGSNSTLLWQFDASSPYCYDDFGLFDAATNSFIIKESGIYEVSVQLIFYGVTTSIQAWGGNIPIVAIVTHSDNSKTSHLMGTQNVTDYPVGTYRVGNFSVVMKLNAGDKVAPKLKWVYASASLEGGFLAVGLPISESQGGATIDSPANFRIRKL
ncbi:hypothetical protein [Chryseobacterium bernardetii]|uniref:hypothetical protein n=1 Tax=Chryseobacterium bernardetii TaxID=1241978 RepID=UPI00301A688A